MTCAFVRGLLGTTGTQRPDMRAGGNGTFGRLDFGWASGGPLKIQFNKRNVLGFAVDFAEDFTKTNWGFEFTWVENETHGVTTKRDGFRKADVYNLTVSIDRPTFINFLNQNRTFFFNSQWFFQYIPEYKRQGVFTGNGPLNILATFTVQTGYFQDRLLLTATYVHDFPSASGGFLYSLLYRFTSQFSAELTVRTFYGGPEDSVQGLFPAALLDQQYGDFKTNTQYGGLSLLAERDEVGIAIRYTF